MVEKRKKRNREAEGSAHQENEDLIFDNTAEIKKIAREDYQAYLEIESNQSRLNLQYILWMSAGALALTLSTLKTLFSLAVSKYPYLVFCSMLSFFITIILIFITLKFSSDQYFYRLDALDSKRKYGKLDKSGAKSEDKCISKRKKVEFFEIISLISFSIGFVLLFIFIYINYENIIGVNQNNVRNYFLLP